MLCDDSDSDDGHALYRNLELQVDEEAVRSVICYPATSQEPGHKPGTRPQAGGNQFLDRKGSFGRVPAASYEHTLVRWFGPGKAD